MWLAAQPRAAARRSAGRRTGSGCGPSASSSSGSSSGTGPDAPPRNPVIAGDIPKKPEPLPKFLDDRDAARLMAAARASADPRDRLVVELLARTGMRAGELADLDADAVVQIGAGHWLRDPAGQAPQRPLRAPAPRTRRAARRLDRRQPRAHPRATSGWSPTTAARWTGTSSAGSCAGSAGAAGVPGVHPHRLRHTLATQAINRGMRLEAIAALLGHQKMEMTLIYAKIANRVVADEYAAVSAKIDALYGQPPELPADYETTGMARLRREAHARMLGNGLCTRPAELDCRLESACETCAYFRTGTQFLPILTRQRDHARDHGQADRAALFEGLIQRAEPTSNGADHHAPDHPRPRRRSRARRDAHLPRRLAIRQPETGPRARAWPPSSATPPTTSTPSAPTCTGSPSSSASADGEELFGEPTP